MWERRPPVAAFSAGATHQRENRRAEQRHQDLARIACGQGGTPARKRGNRACRMAAAGGAGWQRQ
jgi:hypothetical protein